jgi:crossover junction endodeoxyribonuclease RuvC
MYYAGIDQSYTSTGVVILNAQGDVVSYELIPTLKSDGDDFDRSLMAAESIVSKINSVADMIDDDLDTVALEGLSFGTKGMTLQRLAGLQSAIVIALRQAGFNTVIYAPQSVKKFATGSGKGDKEELFNALPERVRKQFEAIPKSNGRYDLTDAFWIAKKLEHDMIDKEV